MLINAGRLLMLGVWGFMVLNLIHPFPKPLNYFIHVAMVFTFFMHGLQLTLLKATQGNRVIFLYPNGGGFTHEKDLSEVQPAPTENQLR